MTSETSGQLVLVATPIGNLEDITLRALRVLREADLIACEDTRHTRKLLDHFGIERPTVSYYEQNEVRRTAELLARLEQGQTIALVSDAGTPGLSDPGYRLVHAAVDKGIRVTAAPGAAAAVVALVISGLPTDAFSFVGFLPSRAGARRQLLEEWRNRPETLVFYESPHRLTEALLDLEDVLGGSRSMVAARELTKLHEEAVRGTIAEVRRHFEVHLPRGEFVLVVQGKTTETEAVGGTEQDLATRMRELLAQPEMDEKRALKQLAREWGIGRSDLYRRWQRVKLPG